MQGILIEDLGIDFVKTCLTHYVGDVLFIGIFFAGILLFLTKKDQLQKYISTYTIFLFLTIFNPILVKVVLGPLGQDEVYYRFFWLLPVNLVIAYLFTHFTTIFSSKVKKVAVLCVCVGIVLYLGSPVIYARTLLNFPDNLYKVSDEVLEISEYIHEDSDEENPRIAIDSNLLMVIRQYDASLQLTLERDYVLCWQGHAQFQSKQKKADYQQQKAIMDVIYGGDTSNTYEFINAIQETETDYLVFSKSIQLYEYLVSLGMEHLVETDNYVIYNTHYEEAESYAILQSLNISEEEITISGIENEYSLFFVADSHISLCDERDSALLEKAGQRQAGFVDANGTESSIVFTRLIEASNMLEPDLFIMGGDIIDSAMYASIDYLADALEELDSPYLYGMGNHDFEYGDEYFSDTAYETYLPRLADFREDSSYQIQEYEDLIIFVADDQNNQISENTLNGLKEAIEKEKPIIVISHVPIEPTTDDTSLIDTSIQVWGAKKNGNSKVIIGENGCVPNEYTQEFVELITDEDSPVQLVLAGHIHFYHKDNLTENTVQIVTGPAYAGEGLLITLKPEV